MKHPPDEDYWRGVNSEELRSMVLTTNQWTVHVYQQDHTYDRFYIRVRARNGEILLFGEGYRTRRSCLEIARPLAIRLQCRLIYDKSWSKSQKML